MSVMSIHDTIPQLRAAGNALAPSGSAFWVAPVDDHLAELSPKEQQFIKSWGPHRQSEFATGRMCARGALSALGLESSDLLPDVEGVPIWAKEVVGSISHSRGVAMAVAAKSIEYRLLGLDLEKTNRLSEAATRRVVHPLEVNFVGEDLLKASILFSLKEAFYKAQYPRWRTVGNFHDLALEVDLVDGVANVLEIDARFASELASLQFAFRLVDDYVVSLCWM